MKIIGIMGNPGSGKTTFSDAMGKKENVGIIHVDDLVAGVKKKYFRFFLQSKKENNTTVSNQNNPKLKPNAKYFFYKNKFSFNFLMRLRSFLVVPEIEKMLTKFKQDGKELVLIDDWVLTSHKKLLDRLDHIYLLKRNFIERRQGIKKRDDLSEFEMKVVDLPYSLDLVQIPNGENVSCILNKGNIEDLERVAISEYYKYVTPTFDEKYKVDSKELSVIERAKVSLEKNNLTENKENQSQMREGK